MSGIFGCISSRECVADVFYGTDYHSHLGTKKAGLAFVKDGKIQRSIHSLQNDYFRSKFESELPRFAGSKAGVGVISDTESQPISTQSHLGPFAIVSVSKVDNLDQLVQEQYFRRGRFSEMSDAQINPSELLSILISSGKNFEEGIRLVQRKVKGSCTMLILTPDGILAVRDRYGRTPLVIGKNDEGYVVASETSSFANLGYTVVRDLGPGEAVRINSDGFEQLIQPGNKCQICAFLWVYYGYPSSFYEGINVEDMRYRNGALIAKNDKECQADFCAGIPDSGVGHAIGYSNGRHMIYKRPFVKYTPTWPRSFMPQYQNLRDLVARMKLLPNEAFTRDARIIFLDDSIVRGTQLKDNVSKLREVGVKEVHMRIACPPLLYACKFVNFSASKSIYDLIARRVIQEIEGTEQISDAVLAEYADAGSERYAMMVEGIRQHLKLDSLKFQSLERLVKAIGLPKHKLCTHCWDNSSYY